MRAPLQLAERVLEIVGDRAEAAVSVTAGTTALTRFANNRIHQNVAEERETIALKCTVDGRTAGGRVNQTEDQSLRRLVERVLDAARLSPADPDWPGVTPPAPVIEVEHFDEETAAAAPADRASVVKAFVDAGGGAATEAAGYCSSAAETCAFASSAGQRVQRRASWATIDGIHRAAGGADGSGFLASTSLRDLDGTRAGAEAVDRAVRGVEAEEFAPGRYEVVLDPSCVADVMTFLCWYGFNGKAASEGTSFVHLGEQQFDEAITISDDATQQGTTGYAFDLEGTPKRPVTLVEDGVTRAVVHDRRSAARAASESTGHAAPMEIFGPYPQNLFVASGSGGTTADLVGQVERGLLVHSFWYTRVLDPKTQVVTGLTRNGLFLIEDGEVTRPAKNLRFTQSYVGALGPGRVLGVGSETPLVGEYRVPALRLADWNFTGGASG